MDDLSGITEQVRLPLKIAIHPYYRDHRIGKQAVFPAVEAMSLLANAVKRFRPQRDISRIARARFEKLLPIPTDSRHIEAVCDLRTLENHDLTTGLLTRFKSKNTSMSRMVTHAMLTFPGIRSAVTHPPGNATLEDIIHRDRRHCIGLAAEKIYTQLVPFGRAYRNIKDELLVSRTGVYAIVRAPVHHGPLAPGGLGSPFPLDAAFHAACVWGQRYAGIVAYPVGIQSRSVHRPTQAGGFYQCHVIPGPSQRGGLVFDINIFDMAGTLFESVSGVSMRSLNRGRTRPPSWVLAAP